LRQQLLEACLPRRELTLQSDHLAEVLRLVEQCTDSAHARPGREDLGVEVCDLIGHIIGGALQTGAPADPWLESIEERLHFAGRQLEHEVAGSELRRGQVKAGVVELPAVCRGKADHLVDRGSGIGDLETNRHDDDQLAVRRREHLPRQLTARVDSRSRRSLAATDRLGVAGVRRRRCELDVGGSVGGCRLAVAHVTSARRECNQRDDDGGRSVAASPSVPHVCHAVPTMVAPEQFLDRVSVG